MPIPPVSTAPDLPRVTILGVDPGTNRCGVAAIEIPLRGQERFLWARCLHGSSSYGWERRVRQIAGLLREARGEIAGPCALAIELPYTSTGPRSTGNQGLEKVWAMVGAALAVCEDTQILTVAASAVPKVFARSRLAREEKKLAAVQWAQVSFGLMLGERDHDAAEAIAIACVGGGQWRQQQYAAMQPALTGRRGGKL